MSAKDRQTRPQLKASIEDESFWHLSDRDVLVAIKLEYSQELERLQTATFIRNPNAVRPEGPSISEQLYGQDYAEINRTLVGVLALRWLRNDEYEIFRGSQHPPSIA
jgi:hypothetical protein